jgi:hypothetical protein
LKQIDREFEKKFYSEIINKKLRHLQCRMSGYEDDAVHKIDLITKDNKTISCRIRRYKYYRYFKDITFTHNKGQTGFRTEYEVFLVNPPDLFFYGFADKDENQLIAWRLFDLKVVIQEINGKFITLRDGIPHREKGYGYKILTMENLYKAHFKKMCVYAWVDHQEADGL